MNRLFKWFNMRIDYISATDMSFVIYAFVILGVMLGSAFSTFIDNFPWRFWLFISILLLIKPLHSFHFRKHKVKRK